MDPGLFGSLPTVLRGPEGLAEKALTTLFECGSRVKDAPSRGQTQKLSTTRAQIKDCSGIPLTNLSHVADNFERIKL